MDVYEAVDLTHKIAWAGTPNESGALTAAYAFRAFTGIIGIDKVDTAILDEFVDHLRAKGYAPGTINRHLAAASKVLSVCYDRQIIKSKPKIPLQKEAQGRIRFLTDAEERQLQDFALSSGYHKAQLCADAYTVLIDTGLRLGELLRLQTRDVDFTTNMLSIWQTKNGQPRSIPMTKRVRRILEGRSIGLGFEPVDIIFPLRAYQLQYCWNSARFCMGLADDKQFVIHALRHTFASRLVQRGVNIRVVQELMGHKSITVTMRYTHLAPAQLTSAVALLENDDA